jgi:nitroreductase
MELYDVMRTTFSAREFTSDPVPDEILVKILDHARFAPSGDLNIPAGKRYMAQIKNGESPWNSVDPPGVDAATIEQTPVPPHLTEATAKAAVVLVICVDLKLVASTDQHLDRVGVISGASIYPFTWNILMAARHEGFGGTITSLAVAQEPKIKELLGIPSHVAVCALMPLGRPARRLSKLKRKPVAEFAMRERWDGTPFRAEL